MKLTILLAFAFTLLSSTSAFAQCSYSAYVDFGPAMTSGNLDDKQLVYRSSGLVKNIRSPNSNKNYYAAYTNYKQLKSGEFELINIGPYDSESVAYAELQETISNLQGQGYRRKTNSHSMPAVIISNKNQC